MSAVRTALVAIVATATCISFACGFSFEKELDLRFDNRTDVAFCLKDVETTGPPSVCSEIPPHRKTLWLPGCGGGPKSSWGKNPVGVFIIRKTDGEPIYGHTENCGDWDKTDKRFVIEDRGGTPVVTDSPFHPAGVMP